LVEQRIENPRVGGSIPPQATRINGLHAFARCKPLPFADLVQSRQAIATAIPSMSLIGLHRLGLQEDARGVVRVA
jgi:hypothetical protein